LFKGFPLEALMDLPSWGWVMSPSDWERPVAHRRTGRIIRVQRKLIVFIASILHVSVRMGKQARFYQDALADG
jgi:hypothetical protein